MARRTPQPRDTHERILAAALAEFSARGYADASIDDIAARAGVTKGAVYYYFSDKVDLARDLQRQLWERLAAEAMEALDPDADTATNLVAGFETWLRALAGHDEARFFLRDCWAITELAELNRDGWVGPIRDLLAEGIARGEVLPLDPDALAQVLIGAWAEATLHVLQTEDPGAATDVMRHVVGSLRVAERRTGTKARA